MTKESEGEIMRNAIIFFGALILSHGIMIYFGFWVGWFRAKGVL